MALVLEIHPPFLKYDAVNFCKETDDLKVIIDRMLRLVAATMDSLDVDDQNKYSLNFSELVGKLTMIYSYCMQYGSDLMEIAKNYEAVECYDGITEKRLKADVELIL